jgi:uracil-DNA glycosylase
MAEGQVGNWESVRSKVKGPCPGCPRDRTKMPVHLPRTVDPSKVDFLIVSQEPGFWLRQFGSGEAVEQRLTALCRNGGPPDELKKANPLTKIVQLFGNLDPAEGRVYWTHALKCVPANGDRDVNKEWRKAATKCQEHFLIELKDLGQDELNVVAFGKYALEMCLAVFDGQDIDQELSISEFMQSVKLPLTYKHRFKDGSSKNINLFVFTNPSSEVVKVMKSGGKMTTEEIQELEGRKVREIVQTKSRR